MESFTLANALIKTTAPALLCLRSLIRRPADNLNHYVPPLPPAPVVDVHPQCLRPSRAFPYNYHPTHVDLRHGNGLPQIRRRWQRRAIVRVSERSVSGRDFSKRKDSRDAAGRSRRRSVSDGLLPTPLTLPRDLETETFCKTLRSSRFRRLDCSACANVIARAPWIDKSA